MPNGIVLDNAGNVYGTTFQGGDFFAGTVYKLTPTPDVPWTETVLYSFTPGVGYGAFPEAGVIFGMNENL